MTENTNFLEPAFFSDEPIYYLQSQCTQNSTFSISIELSAATSRQQGTRHPFIGNVLFPEVITGK